MSVSSDLNTLRERVEVLETELDRSRLALDDSVDQTQHYRDQYDELKARYTALRTECNELKVDNRRLTRKLTESDTQFTSPPIAPQSSEVTMLRQRLAEKDEVIAALDAKYQSLLNSKEQAFDSLSANKEAIQSRLAAMLEDAAKTLEASHDGLAQGGPPPDGDAGSKTSATQGATKTPSDHAGSKTSATQGATKSSSSHADSKTSATKRAPKASSSHADSKTSATGGATKLPSERPATGSKSPDPGQQPPIEGSENYSGAVTGKRAELPRHGRAGQARVPVSHEELAKKEALQAAKREEIKRGAGRSLKPNRGGGLQPSEKAPGSSGTTASPAAKPKVAESQVPKPWSASFTWDAEPPSAPVDEEKVAPAPPPALKGQQGSASKGQTPTGSSRRTDLGKTTTPALRTVTNEPTIQGNVRGSQHIRPRSPAVASVSKESEHYPHQVPASGSRIANPFPETSSFNDSSFEPAGNDSWKAPTGYKGSVAMGLDLGTLSPISQESATQDTTSQESIRDTNVSSWADDKHEGQGKSTAVSIGEQRKSGSFGGELLELGANSGTPRGRGQPHHRSKDDWRSQARHSNQPRFHQGRGDGQSPPPLSHSNRGSGRFQAPSSQSRPENYLDKPWRGAQAGRRDSPPSGPTTFHETWKQTKTSEDGTRKRVGVHKSVSVFDRSDGNPVDEEDVGFPQGFFC